MADRRDDLELNIDRDRPAPTGRTPDSGLTADGRTLDRERAIDRPDEAVDGEAVGGVSGLAAGAAIGAATGGPVGAIIGAAAGALTGVGVAKGVDVVVNPDEEDAYWRENYRSRPYVTDDRDYDHYRPAYRYGWEARTRYGADRDYDDIEPELAKDWNTFTGSTGLAWTDARPATRDAWDRIERRRRTT